MRPSPPAQLACTFVVRVWFEWTAGRSFWRGSIEHLESETTRNFRELDAIPDFIQGRLFQHGNAQAQTGPDP